MEQGYLATFKVIPYGYNCSNSTLGDLLYGEHCFNYKQKAAVKTKGLVISSYFLWKLLLFIVKRFYNLLYHLICGLLCLLSYWESINSHS